LGDLTLITEKLHTSALTEGGIEIESFNKESEKITRSVEESHLWHQAKRGVCRPNNWYQQ